MLGYKKQTSDRTISNYGLFLLRCNDEQWHRIVTSIKETPINRHIQVLIKALQQPTRIIKQGWGGGYRPILTRNIDRYSTPLLNHPKKGITENYGKE